MLSFPHFYQQVFIELLLFARHCVRSSEIKGKNGFLLLKRGSIPGG